MRALAPAPVPWALALLALGSCTGNREAPRPAAAPGRPAELDSAPRPAPGEGGRFPRLSADPRGGLNALWTEELPGAPGGQRLRMARYGADGFGAAATVAEGSGWFVNWADVPQIAVGADGARTVTWLEKLGDGAYAYGVRYRCLPAQATEWTAPAWLHTDRAEVEHGFTSLAALEGGRFAAVWLDGHATAAGGGHDDHGHGHGGAMALRTATIERDGSPTGEHELDARVCDCCPTALARLASGELIVAYRDRGPDELRDISIVRGRPGDARSWSAPRAVHADGWRIAGCPVNGPALSAEGSAVVCAWFTMGADETARVRVARSTDGGLSFGPPERVDDGDPLGRVSLAPWPGGGWVMVWLEQTGPETAEWRARVLGAALEPGSAVTLGEVPAARPAGSAALASLPGGALVLWTDPVEGSLRAAELRPR